MIGKTLGYYQITNPLGKGGTREVLDAILHSGKNLKMEEVS